MKIKSNISAGMTFEECNLARNRMKQAAQSGNCSALNWGSQQPSYPTNLPSYPPVYYPPQQPVYPPVYYPPSQPSQPTQGGGYYGGVFYADRSGSCG